MSEEDSGLVKRIETEVGKVSGIAINVVGDCDKGNYHYGECEYCGKELHIDDSCEHKAEFIVIEYADGSRVKQFSKIIE